MESPSPAVVKKSRFAFAETITRLTEAIEAAGNTLFAAIDQSAAARGAGLTLRPTTLLVFGNPKGGTPLMGAFPLAALDLPLKLVVWEDDSGVSVAYTPIALIVQRYGITGKDALVAKLQDALETLASSVA